MENIEKLNELFREYRVEFSSIDKCIKWAEERLANNEEGNDQEIIALAGTVKREDAEVLVKRILERYLGGTSENDELFYGRYLIKLHEKYKNEQISIHQLDDILNNIYVGLEYPLWLTMLSRNCELSTHMPDYKEPFEKEFNYVTGLWQSVDSLEEFTKLYDRDISNSHDLKWETVPSIGRYFNVIIFIVIIVIIIGITFYKKFVNN